MSRVPPISGAARLAPVTAAPNTGGGPTWGGTGSMVVAPEESPPHARLQPASATAPSATSERSSRHALRGGFVALNIRRTSKGDILGWESGVPSKKPATRKRLGKDPR